MHVYGIADPLGLEADLSEDERRIRDATSRMVDDELLPIIAEAFEAGRFPRELIPSFAKLGLLGGPLSGYGCAGLGQVAYGLAVAELERGDSGVRSFVSVHSTLCMWPIHAFGSEEQKQQWLPAMARGEKIGCFGLTEPTSGSDPASMKTVARRDGTDWVLTGEKRWVTNGTFADVAVIWAKAEGEGEGASSIRGFLVPTDSPGLERTEIEGKMSLRASASGAFRLGGVRVPADAMLPGAKGLKAALSCLNQARYGIAWGATGALAACLESARDYTVAREQFGKALAARQLVQARLAEMYSALGHAQLLAMRIGRLKETGRLNPVQISFAKRANVDAALQGARTARDLLGANGILLEHPPVRHLLNLETVRTYEGTHDVHTLVLGRAITGLDAFS